MRKRSWVSAALLAGAAPSPSCGGEPEPSADSTLTVYVSLPLRGPCGADGRDAADGARLALADADGQAGGVAGRGRVPRRHRRARAPRARWTPARPAANARTATEDSTAIAYIGDFESGATRASLPITNGARLLQVSPASSAEDLVEDFPGDDELPETQPGVERTFGRVIPSDTVQARAAAHWARRLVGDAAVATEDGSAFGRRWRRSSGARSDRTSGTPRTSSSSSTPAHPTPSRGVLSPSFDGEIMVSDAELPPAAGSRAGPYATSAALDPTQLPPAGRDFARRFRAEYGRAPGRYAAYGYEAMALILDSIDRASDPVDRASVIDAFFDTADRDSVLGTYSIDDLGETTLDRLTGYRLDRGRARPVAEVSGGQ